MSICRFAPSPTGKLHLGGARTALFNWAFARHTNGVFAVRIEDTDRERSTVENEKSIMAALNWLGMAPDIELVHQSKRSELYKKAALRLLEEGQAYKCFASKEELDELRANQQKKGEKPRYDRRWRERNDHPQDKKYCIRFKTPLEGTCVIDDLIRGVVTVKNKEFDDPVILREDETATYNFAAVVDDGDMKITHVIRGEDHLTNTLRQTHIHKALEQLLPKFAHLPMILGQKLDEDKNPVLLETGEPAYERLSKRNNSVDIDFYKEQGYLPEALVNYLAQLGWTQPGKEVYSSQELVKEFKIEKVNKSAARFNLDRINWINQQHMREMDVAQLAKYLDIDAPDQAIQIATEKANTLVQMKEELSWLQDPKDLDGTLLGQLGDDNKEAFIKLCETLISSPEIKAADVKNLIKETCKEHGVKFPKLGMPLRAALTGSLQSPDVATIVELLGEKSNERLEKALSLIKS